MEPQIKPNRWSCVTTAMAMVLGVTTEDLFEALGHDGSEIVAPGLKEPRCRRGVHIQELNHIAVQRGLILAPYELAPAIRTEAGEMIPILSQERKEIFQLLIETEQGVLSGRGRNRHHAVAFDRGQIINPDNGEEYIFTFEACENRGFIPQCAWLVSKLMG